MSKAAFTTFVGMLAVSVSYFYLEAGTLSGTVMSDSEMRQIRGGDWGPCLPQSCATCVGHQMCSPLTPNGGACAPTIFGIDGCAKPSRLACFNTNYSNCYERNPATGCGPFVSPTPCPGKLANGTCPAPASPCALNNPLGDCDGC